MEITDAGRCSQEQSCSLLLFVLPSPFLLTEMHAVCMLGVSKLASVLGVPGEQLRHNSRVEWAGECRGGKMNSMPWGFPNPGFLQGLYRLHCSEFYSYLPQVTKYPVFDERQRMKNICGLTGFLTLANIVKNNSLACNTVYL